MSQDLDNTQVLLILTTNRQVDKPFQSTAPGSRSLGLAYFLRIASSSMMKLGLDSTTQSSVSTSTKPNGGCRRGCSNRSSYEIQKAD